MSAVVIKQLLLVKHPFQKAVLFACNSTQTNNVPPVLWPVVVPERCIISNERSNSSSMYSIPPTSSFSYRKDDKLKEEDDLSLYISIELDIDTDHIVNSEKDEKQPYYASDSSASDEGFDW